MIAADALALWSTRTVRCAVLTPEPVRVEAPQWGDLFAARAS